MGFALTLFYLFTTFLTPAEIIPALLPYRIMLVLLLVTLMASVFTMLGHRFSFKEPQMLLLVALLLDIALSVLYADRWFSGALDAALDFLFLVGIVLMVCWNVVTLSRLRLLAWLLAIVGVVICVQGVLALTIGYRPDTFVFEQHDQDSSGNAMSFTRMKGLGVLDDPNDLGQFLLIDIALLGCCWKKGSAVRNGFLIVLPGGIMLAGIFLTKSRGAMLALLGMLFLLLQKRLGKVGVVAGAIAGVGGLVAMTALTGRDISLQEGSAAGRLDAWYAGFQMLKGSPLLGVGFQRFLEHNPLTAHNSYMLCLAELGLPGFFLWLGIIVSSVLSVRAVSVSVGGTPELDDLKQSARSVFIALMMFVVTAWFLSRSYTTILFVLVGCSIALSEIARRSTTQAMEKPKISWPLSTVAGAIGFMAIVYVLLRVRGLG